MKRKTVFVIIVLIVIAGTLILVGNHFYQPNTQIKNSNSDTINQVEQVVKAFGSKLKMVSILAPEQIRNKSIKEWYSPFVSSDLLLAWENGSLQVPGRTTSNPFPDRIEISSVTQLNDLAYTVSGTVIDVLTGDTSPVTTNPVAIVVKYVGGAWRITSFVETTQKVVMNQPVSVVALEVVEDSRCPIYAKCIWMGTVRVRVRVTNAKGVFAEDIVTLSEPKIIAGVKVTLTEVSPAKISDSIPFSDYKFIFTTK